MTRFCLTDRMTLDNVAEDSYGRLVINGRVARGGNVQDYLGSELGKPDMRVVRVYRPEEEVFDKASMASFPHKLVTLEHPAGGGAVFDRDGQGWIGDSVARDGEFIRVPMIVAGKQAVDSVKARKTEEFSVGYGTDLVWQAGKSPKGEEYDAYMTNIAVDHVAIVGAARGGSALRIGDWLAPGATDLEPITDKGGHQMAEVLRKVMVDGLSVETTEQGAQAIDKLKSDIVAKDAAIAAVKQETLTLVAAKDTALAAKDAEIADLKKQVMSPAALDAAVKTRGDFLVKAKAVHDADYSGKSEAEVRAIVVAAKFGDEAVKDKSEAYIQGLYDHAVKTAVAKPDPVRDALLNRGVTTTTTGNVSDSQKAYDEMIARNSNAWKGETSQGA